MGGPRSGKVPEQSGQRSSTRSRDDSAPAEFVCCSTSYNSFILLEHICRWNLRFMTKSGHDHFLKQLENLNVWKRGDQRAPHKPLLLLWYLGHVQRGGERLVPFSELYDPLRNMLIEYGPPRKSFHPEYPFWRLQNDGIWEIHAPAELRRRKGNTDVPRNELLKHNAVGGLSESFYRALRDNPLELNRAAELLLERNFPGSLHDEIAASVGLVLAARSIRD